jgi:membrane associated rhomboid family serine protease
VIYWLPIVAAFTCNLYRYAKVNAKIAAGQVWRLVTPAVLHGSVVGAAYKSRIQL